MKRSQHLRLSLMAATLPAALAGCDPGPPTGTVITAPSDCDTVVEVSTEECRTAYMAAIAKHKEVAPRFTTQTECNEAFGQCDVVQEPSGAFWIPPMSGFLLGYALAAGTDRDSYRYRYGGALPLYRDFRSGEYYKPSGDYVSAKPGKVHGATGSTAAPTRAITVSRSGFGSTSAARSSFGG